jgi:hypothetical protein
MVLYLCVLIVFSLHRESLKLILVMNPSPRWFCHNLARIDPVYIENVHHFVEEAMRHANREKKSNIFCPCVDCDNKIPWLDSKAVKSHLIKRGFKKSYTIWIAHGEIDNALLDVDRGDVRDDNSHY